MKLVILGIKLNLIKNWNIWQVSDEELSDYECYYLSTRKNNYLITKNKTINYLIEKENRIWNTK